MIRINLGLNLLIAVLFFTKSKVVSVETLDVYSTANASYEIKCSKLLNEDEPLKCFSNVCKRVVTDNLFPEADILKLKNIALKGMSQRLDVGGPTILDINTGYLRDSEGLENLFYRERDVFTSQDFSDYADIILRLKKLVESTFNITDLYFTAPTFITRLDGRESWTPKGIHDEYWHTHADGNNTEHYHYSGLLYMSELNKDFTGGRLVFQSGSDDTTIDQIVEPKPGRVAIFTSGPENPHYVEKVTSGQRFVLSFWFTCDAARSFPIYLDGKAHIAFSHRMRDINKKKSKASRRDL